MTVYTRGLAFLGICALCATVVEGQQAGWSPRKKQISRPTSTPGRVGAVSRPRAEIGGAANGLYCTAPWTNGVAVHDLGYIPTGFNVSVTVESFSPEFNPAAAVLVASLGQPAANTIKTTTFYDDDSGGDRDPRITFVAPQDGTYLLMVNDVTDGVTGCYRYQVMVG